MGFLRKLTGGTDKKLLETGILGQGIIADVQLTGTTIQMGNGLVQRSCVFTVQVTLDSQEPYTTRVKQRVPEVMIPQFQPGSTMVAVRVDPEDPNNVALDFDSPLPKITMTRNSGNVSAADLLASGQPARAVIVASQPLNQRNAAGVDLYAFTLTVMPTGRDPYQIQVGNPMPARALPLVYAGSHVPVKIGSTPNAVAIDWDQALADTSHAG